MQIGLNTDDTSNTDEDEDMEQLAAMTVCIVHVHIIAKFAMTSCVIMIFMFCSTTMLFLRVH